MRIAHNLRSNGSNCIQIIHVGVYTLKPIQRTLRIIEITKELFIAAEMVANFLRRSLLLVSIPCGKLYAKRLALRRGRFAYHGRGIFKRLEPPRGWLPYHGGCAVEKPGPSRGGFQYVVGSIFDRLRPRRG